MIVFKKGKDTDCGEFTATESSPQYVLNWTSHSTAARGRARLPPSMGASGSSLPPEVSGRSDGAEMSRETVKKGRKKLQGFHFSHSVPASGVELE